MEARLTTIRIDAINGSAPAGVAFQTREQTQAAEELEQIFERGRLQLTVRNPVLHFPPFGFASCKLAICGRRTPEARTDLLQARNMIVEQPMTISCLQSNYPADLPLSGTTAMALVRGRMVPDQRYFLKPGLF